jgi:hypothetical protein
MSLWYRLRNREGEYLCNDGEWRPYEPNLFRDYEQREKVYKTKAGAASAATHIDRITTIEEVIR